MGSKQVVSADGETFTLFISEKSPFSNLHPCSFIATGGDGKEQRFNSVEQFYMYNKALSSGDVSTAQHIVRLQNPKEMKQLGKQTKNFDKKKWDSMRESVMRRGLYAKFTQSMVLRQKLFLTRGSAMVEASEFDQYWGNGVSINNQLSCERSAWRGQNVMGNLLTELRNSLWVMPEYETQKKFAMEQQSTHTNFFSLHFPPC